jgi:hypothetical protein
MLADGTIVTASPCQNLDLYRALRGDGPGYGVILSLTVKAHPDVHIISVQRLELAPKGTNTSATLDAMTIMFQSFPDINDAGFAGYGYWAINAYQPLFGNSSAGYYHDFWNIGNNTATAKASFAPIRAKLETLQDFITISETYKEYTDYWSMYEAESGLNDTVGLTAVMSSRLFDRESVSDYQKVRNTLPVVIGPAEEFGQNTILLVSGGQVANDAADPYSGLHPAWRSSPFVSIVGRGWAGSETSEEVKAYIKNDVTNVKGAAMKALAPKTGGYMNEGDRLDPEWQETFYGSNYAAHSATKQEYDPDSLFYCPTCVGSENWIERPDAPLCRV